MKHKQVIDGFDNVFYDEFSEVVNYDCAKEVWEDARVICLYDTNSNIGLFQNSDIILMYDKVTEKPSIITERIFKKNYKWLEWKRVNRYLKLKIKTVKHELGFNVSVNFGSDYIDFVHYKTEYHLWAIESLKQ